MTLLKTYAETYDARRTLNELSRHKQACDRLKEIRLSHFGLPIKASISRVNAARVPVSALCKQKVQNRSGPSVSGQSHKLSLKSNVVFGSAGRPGCYAHALFDYVRPRLFHALWPRRGGLDCAREPPEDGDVRRQRGESPRTNELQQQDVGKPPLYEPQCPGFASSMFQP